MSHQDLSPQGWAPKIQKKGRTLTWLHSMLKKYAFFAKLIY